VVEGGRIFADPLALRILGIDPEEAARDAREKPSDRRMRLFIAARHRVAEEALARALERGVRQVVVLGAGLDTWAYRAKVSSGVRAFEVDHGATQAWKRERLEEAGIAVPPFLTFAPVDFEEDTLERGLDAAGFDSSQACFFSWLGVVPYLSPEATWATLDLVARLPRGTGVVFDYSDPPELLSPDMRAFHDARAARVAAVGEAWRSYFDAQSLRDGLFGRGFTEVEDLGPREIAMRFFPGRVADAPAKGGHILRAERG
jgi:methyltransferase (TIGR00027 family)